MTETLRRWTLTRVLITTAGVVCGYLVMVLLITLVQEVWFGGVAWGKTPLGALTVAGALTCLSGAAGGAVANLIARPKGMAAAGVMAILIVVEMTALYSTGKLNEPLWFDFASAAALMVAILLGGYAFLRWTAASGEPATG